MTVDGATHERRNVCMWTTLFSRRGGSDLPTQRIAGVDIVPVHVEWLESRHSYAIDPVHEVIYRHDSDGSADVLSPLDYEFYESIFSEGLRTSLDRLLGGDNIYAAAADPGLQDHCIRRVDAGDYGTDAEALTNLTAEYRRVANRDGIEPGNVGSGVLGWSIPLARSGVNLLIPADANDILMLQPGEAAGLFSRDRLLEHGLTMGDVLRAVVGATRG